MRMPLFLLGVFVFGGASLCHGLACDNGWFGSKCQYKCHCTENGCDDDGECTGDAQCEKGWFGPACQYADLTVTHGTHPTSEWLLDGDDTTCNPDPTQQNVTVVLKDVLIFSWLRVRVTNPAILLLEDSTIKEAVMLRAWFRGWISPSSVAKVDAVTLDFGIWINDVFTGVSIREPLVKSLCSVHISGGRNVAIRQETSQSSIDDSLSASWHLLDGDINGNYTQGSCSATGSNGSDLNPSWNVTFSRPYLIYYVKVFDTKDAVSRQTSLHSDLKITGYGVTGNRVYVDFMMPYPRQVKSRDVFNTMHYMMQRVTVSRFSIETADRSPLSLCEIEIYGDSKCEEGRYGRECEYTCNCAGNGTCFVSTGGCPSGCADGYTGESCHEDRFCAGAETEEIGDRCVRLVNERVKWQEAKAACEALGPRVSLVELTSNAVREYVQNMTVAIGSRAWLGATDSAVEGQWVWSSTGNDLDIDPSWWGQGQPDNSYGNENCLIMRPDRFLNDYNCNVGLPYFCQSFK